jgi:hypothetical protein
LSLCPYNDRITAFRRGSDPEFEMSVCERNKRRRRILSALVDRMAAGRDIKPREIDNLVDVLFALTSFHFLRN